jgi:hypothetical protein
MSLEKIYNAQVIGAGPAAAGVLVAADRTKKLDSLLKLGGGIAFIEGAKNPIPGEGNLASYNINSNSAPEDFLEGFRSDGAFGHLVHYGPFQERIRRGDTTIPLQEVKSLLQEVGRVVSSLLKASDSHLIPDTTVTHLRQRKDGSWRSVDNQGAEVASSRQVVLATGSQEVPLDLGGNSHKLVLSNALLTSPLYENGLADRLERYFLPPAVGKILVLGGAHSAFSVVNLLAQIAEDAHPTSHNVIQDGAIQVFHKSPVRLFYESVGRARENDYEFNPETDVCATTGRVHRYGGIRNDAKDVFLNIRDSVEKRWVNLTRYSGDIFEIQKQLNRAELIIQAIGSRVRKVALVDVSGNEIGPLVNNHGKVEVDEQARVIGHNGDTIPGVYGTGLGYGLNPNKKIGGEPGYKGGGVDSFNIYCGAAGQFISDQLVDHLFAPLEDCGDFPPRTVWNDFQVDEIRIGDRIIRTGVDAYNPPPSGVGHYGVDIQSLHDDGTHQWIVLKNLVTNKEEVFLVQLGIEDYFTFDKA